MQCSRRRRRGSSNSHMMRMDRACRLLRKSRFLYALIVGVNFVSSWGSQVANRLEVTEECLATGWLRGGGCGRRAVSGYPTTHNHKPSTQSPTQTHPPTQSPPPSYHPPTQLATHPPTHPHTHTPWHRMGSGPSSAALGQTCLWAVVNQTKGQAMGKVQISACAPLKRCFFSLRKFEIEFKFENENPE